MAPIRLDWVSVAFATGKFEMLGWIGIKPRAHDAYALTSDIGDIGWLASLGIGPL